MRENLKYERIQKGLTQAHIAELLSISLRQYRRIESGISNGALRYWEIMRDYFQKPVDYLIANKLTSNIIEQDAKNVK